MAYQEENHDEVIPAAENKGREDRRTNRERRDDRNEERRSRENTDRDSFDDRTEQSNQQSRIYGQSARNNIYRNSGDGGRASQLAKTHNELMKDAGESPSKLMVITGEASRNLPNKLGWLVYVTPQGADVFFHILVMEGQKECVIKKPFRSRDRDDRRREREDRDLYRYISTNDMFDGNMMDTVKAFVENNFSFTGEACFTGYTIIPFEIQVTDGMEFGPYITAADDSNWNVAGVDKAFDVSYVKKDHELQLSLSFQPGQVAKDLGNMPLRADFIGNIEEVACYNRNNSDSNWNESDQAYVGLSAFISPRWVGAEDDRGYDRRRKPEPTRQYVPELNISMVDTFTGPELGSVERMLLALGAAPFFNTDDRWMTQFKSSFDSKNPMRDIAALGYGFDSRVIDPERLDDNDVREALSDDRKFSTFMDRVFYCDDGIDVAFLVREGSPSYAVARILIDAFDGVKSAQLRIEEALDNITNTRFDFDGDIVSSLVRVPTGYYIGSDGERHPIEDFDTLAVLSRLGDKNVNMIEDWIECTRLGSSRFDYETRIHRMVEILKYATNETFTMKGFVDKLYINGAFLEKLHKEICRSKMALTIDQDGNSNYNTRSRNSGERYALSNNLASRRGRYDSARGSRRDDYRSADVRYRRY